MKVDDEVWTLVKKCGIPARTFGVVTQVLARMQDRAGDGRSIGQWLVGLEEYTDYL